jgi:predicted nuclease of predicted toxin-antitoxin system
MKLKVDENLPDSLASSLVAIGHDADTSVQEGRRGCDDEDVWAAAMRAGRLLITQDVRFADARRVKPEGSGILLLRVKQDDFALMHDRVLEVFRMENVEAWAGCVVKVTLRQIRVHRPS